MARHRFREAPDEVWQLGTARDRRAGQAVLTLGIGVNAKGYVQYRGKLYAAAYHCVIVAGRSARRPQCKINAGLFCRFTQQLLLLYVHDNSNHSLKRLLF